MVFHTAMADPLILSGIKSILLTCGSSDVFTPDLQTRETTRYTDLKEDEPPAPKTREHTMMTDNKEDDPQVNKMDLIKNCALLSKVVVKMKLICIYSETCLNRTLNKTESCIKQTLNKETMLRKSLLI
jgi:hypothetical protein